MSNETYDKLKWVAQILLPALATLVYTIAKIWGLQYAMEIVGTISAADVFLGTLLQISTMRYLELNEEKKE